MIVSLYYPSALTLSSPTVKTWTMLTLKKKKNKNNLPPPQIWEERNLEERKWFLETAFFVSLTVFKSFIFPFRFLAVPCGVTETSLLLYVRKFGAPRPSDAFILTKHRTRRMFRHFLGSHGSLASTLGFDFTFPEGLVCGSHHARCFPMLIYLTLWRVQRENRYGQAHAKEIKTKAVRCCNVPRAARLVRGEAEAWPRSPACHITYNCLVIVTEGKYFFSKRCREYVYPTQFVIWLVSMVKWNNPKSLQTLF